MDFAAIQRATFLERMRQVPAPVAIIACSTDGEKGGLVATAWASLCADPPMMLACVNQSASAHDLFDPAGAFSVNLVSCTDISTVGLFSGKDARTGSARFVDGQWDVGPLGQPLLKSAVASFECTLETRHVHGTHSILIGRVGATAAFPGSDPLLYLNGSYAHAVSLD